MLDSFIQKFLKIYPSRRSQGRIIPNNVKTFIFFQLFIVGIVIGITPYLGNSFTLSGQTVLFFLIIFTNSLIYQGYAYRADSGFLVKDISEIIFLSSIIIFENFYITILTVIFYMLTHFIFGMRAFYQLSFNFSNSIITSFVSFHLYRIISQYDDGSFVVTFVIGLLLYVIHYSIDLIQTLFVVSQTMKLSFREVLVSSSDVPDEIFQLFISTFSLVYLLFEPDLFYILYIMLTLMFNQQMQRQKELKSKKEAESKLHQLELERELEKAKVEKFESLKIMAGNVAHDINNFLTIIKGNVYLLENQPEYTQSDFELKNIKLGIDNIKNLIDNLIDYSTSENLRLSKRNLNMILDTIINFVTSDKEITIEKQYIDPNIMIELDEVKINQAISNLLVNSIQAEASKISIMTKAKHQNGKSSAEIIITDNGNGIPKHLIDSIFEPYITSKTNGHGLGMAITYSIIKKHKGDISVVSKEAEGTRISIELPLNQQQNVE